jgi:hypothetical protein
MLIAAVFALSLSIWSSTAFAGFEFRIAPTGAPAMVGDTSGTFSVFADFVDPPPGAVVFNTYQYQLTLSALNGAATPITINTVAPAPGTWIPTQNASGMLSTVGNNTSTAQGVNLVLQTLDMPGESVELARYTYSIPSGFGFGDTFTLDVAGGSLVGGANQSFPAGTQSATFGVAVPEPSSAMLISVLGLAVCMRRRRA